jgi:uncharacterized membrane protein YhhN
VNAIFRNLEKFSILFFAMLLIDIIVKETLPTIPYRYISKPIIVILLFGYYWYNSNALNKNTQLLTFCALGSFLIGDILLIKGAVNGVFLAIGVSFFVLGKAFYSFRFSHSNDFKMGRLIPFFIFCFIFLTAVFLLIYDNLGQMFIPIVIYAFVALMMLQLAFLRKHAVSRVSYYMVLIGALITIVSDTVTALKEFYAVIPYQEILIMLFYGVSQYFIIVGLVKGEQNELKLINT